MAVILRKARRVPRPVRSLLPRCSGPEVAALIQFVAGCRHKGCKFAARHGKRPNRERFGNVDAHLMFAFALALRFVQWRAHHKMPGGHNDHLRAVSAILETLAGAGPESSDSYRTQRQSPRPRIVAKRRSRSQEVGSSRRGRYAAREPTSLTPAPIRLRAWCCLQESNPQPQASKLVGTWPAADNRSPDRNVVPSLWPQLRGFSRLSQWQY